MHNTIRFLTCDMFRPNADCEYHKCHICMKKMQFTNTGEVLDWMKCPICDEITHSECLLRYIRETSTLPMCGICRNPIPVNTDTDTLDTRELYDKWSFDQSGEDLIDDSSSASSSSSWDENDDDREI